MQDMGKTDVGDYTYVKYLLPTRGSIGLRTNLLSATRGTAVIDSNFDSYRAFAGDIEARDKGSLLAFEDGEATSHGLLGAQDRGQLFATPKTAVYKDMVVGVHQRPGDLRVNVCKQKQLTNMRSATKGIVEGLSPPLELTLRFGGRVHLRGGAGRGDAGRSAWPSSGAGTTKTRRARRDHRSSFKV